MKSIFRSFLFSAVLLIAGVAVSCTETKENTGGFQGIPTISVTPASVTVPLAGGTTEAVVVTTPAEWTLDIDAEGVVASSTSGVGESAVTFEVPASTAMRTIKVTFTATGYVSGFPEQWLAWHPTCHHEDPRPMELAKTFVEGKPRNYPV